MVRRSAAPGPLSRGPLVGPASAARLPAPLPVLALRAEVDELAGALADRDAADSVERGTVLLRGRAGAEPVIERLVAPGQLGSGTEVGCGLTAGQYNLPSPASIEIGRA